MVNKKIETYMLWNTSQLQREIKFIGKKRKEKKETYKRSCW